MQLYDPQETGYMSVDSLQFFIENLGLDELSSEDMEALIQAADVDQDGRIGLDDFRNMIKAKYELFFFDFYVWTIKALYAGSSSQHYDAL